MAKRVIGKLSAEHVAGVTKPGRYGDGGGLSLVVSADRPSAWVFRFTWYGKPREMGLGPLRYVSIDEARIAAAEARKLVRSGCDPIEARKDARRLERGLDKRTRAKANLSQETVRELLDYDPDTGALTWKATGKPAGGKHSGYVIVKLFGTGHRAHRLIWLYMTGAWPTAVVDHINRVRGDNRWCNLRDVTHSQNARNRPVGRNNTSGATGVTYQRGRYFSEIRLHGRHIHLGCFDTVEQAAAARLHAERSYFAAGENPANATPAKLRRIKSRQGRRVMAVARDEADYQRLMAAAEYNVGRRPLVSQGGA